MERGRILAVLWPIWLHSNEVVLEERAVSAGVDHNVGVSVSSRCRGRCRVKGGLYG